MARYRYTDEDITSAVDQSESIAGVLRVLGIKLSGGSHTHISRRIKRLELDTSHFTGQGHNKGKRQHRRSPEYFLRRLDADANRIAAHYLRRALRELGHPYHCAECSTGETWQGRSLTLHVDHIDGDPRNCLEENLRFLCPNCHSQTATYCRTVESRRPAAA